MAHSPTPWFIDGDGYVFDANSKEVILSSTDNIGLIVEAVNAYEANQALIRQLVEAFEFLYCSGNCWDDEHTEAIKAAKKAGF